MVCKVLQNLFKASFFVYIHHFHTINDFEENRRNTSEVKLTFFPHLTVSTTRPTSTNSSEWILNFCNCINQLKLFPQWLSILAISVRYTRSLSLSCLWKLRTQNTDKMICWFCNSYNEILIKPFNNSTSSTINNNNYQHHITTVTTTLELIYYKFMRRA